MKTIAFILWIGAACLLAYSFSSSAVSHVKALSVIAALLGVCCYEWNNTQKGGVG